MTITECPASATYNSASIGPREVTAMRPSARVLTSAAVAAAFLSLTACSTKELTQGNVLDFIDAADDAARDYAYYEVCDMRAESFVAYSTDYPHDSSEPVQSRVEKDEFCRNFGRVSRHMSYVIERNSIEIAVAPDAQTAVVTAEYVEKMPAYRRGVQVSGPDDYDEVQIFETHDVTTVGIEDGRIVILETTSVSHQKIVPRAEMPLPRR
jgi:hypothetical protein